MIRRLITLADDTTQTHCGSCHHAINGYHQDEACRADSWPGEPLVWDASAGSSLRSAACHEATMGQAVLALVMGSKPMVGHYEDDRFGYRTHVLPDDEQGASDALHSEQQDREFQKALAPINDDEAPPSTDPAPPAYNAAAVAADRRSDIDETPPLAARASER